MATPLDTLKSQLELADALLAGRNRMFEPQDLPGRYGRVVKALDHLLQAVGCEAVLGGGWAVWRHGFLGRVTQDADVMLGAADVDAFLRAAAVSGFDVLPQPPGRWPKLMTRVIFHSSFWWVQITTKSAMPSQSTLLNWQKRWVPSSMAP